MRRQLRVTVIEAEGFIWHIGCWLPFPSHQYGDPGGTLQSFLKNGKAAGTMRRP